MTMLLQQMGLWHWLIAAVVLLIGEMLVPGTFLVWLGLGAASTGLLLLLFPALPWQAQWIVFAVVSVGSVLLWRRYRRQHPAQNDHPTLNRRGMR
jgi:inner membrane protein